MRERKFIVGLDSQDHLKLKAGYVLFHRDLIDIVKNFSENHDVRPIGGGFWTVKDGDAKLESEDKGDRFPTIATVTLKGDRIKEGESTTTVEITGITVTLHDGSGTTFDETDRQYLEAICGLITMNPSRERF